jgi:hypothetical protein
LLINKELFLQEIDVEGREAELAYPLNDEYLNGISEGLRLAKVIANSDSVKPQSGKESTPSAPSNTGSIKLPTELELSKCRLFDECPATNKGHVGCYSTGPCFG